MTQNPNLGGASHGQAGNAGADGDPTGPTRGRGVWMNVLGELILLATAGMLFGYIVLDSRGIIGDPWPLSAAVMPWTAVAIGVPLLVARLVQVMRTALRIREAEVEEATQQQIMDVGFNFGQDPKKEAKRFAAVLGAIGVLYLSIWLLGFFITIPAWLMAYMVFVGRAKLRWALLTTGIVFAFMYGVYDQVLRVRWPNPVLFDLFS